MFSLLQNSTQIMQKGLLEQKLTVRFATAQTNGYPPISRIAWHCPVCLPEAFLGYLWLFASLARSLSNFVPVY